ncbi:MAG: hypothetical protein HKM93_08990 [Desulfobacteraceae bacterium]|nr:hypothetical protein [Desulfobacteraceae bacterium]
MQFAFFPHLNVPDTNGRQLFNKALADNQDNRIINENIDMAPPDSIKPALEIINYKPPASHNGINEQVGIPSWWGEYKTFWTIGYDAI